MDKYSTYFALLLLMVCGVTACHTQKEYSISSYQVYLEVQRDGTYHVREQIRFDFEEGSFSSAHRAIPLEDIDSLQNIRVHSAQTSIDSVTTNREDKTQHIRWYYSERSEPVRFTVDYSVTGALYEEDQRNIVDWDAVGTDCPCRSIRFERM